MWTVLMVTVVWLSLTYKFGIQSLYFLILIDFFLLFVSKKFTGQKGNTVKMKYFAGFIVSFFQSFYQSVRILFFLLRGRLYRGVYETKVDQLSRIDLFFLSMGITIVPNTIYIDKFGDVLLVHKIDRTEKAAHKAEPVLFSKKIKK